MARIMAVRVKRVFIALSFSKITGERTEGHSIHLCVTRPICALDVHRKFLPRFLVHEGQIWIKVLLRAQLDFKAVRLSELHEHWEQQQFKNFGDDLGIH